jgi:NAD(P)H dehydrogenase (quinone)
MTRTIAVFGATGQLGARVVRSLLTRGVPANRILAIGRNEARLDDLAEQGVRLHRADLDRPDEVAVAVQGADAVLLISASEPGRRIEQHRTVIDAAAAAGVGRLVYTSAPNAQQTTLVLAPDHKATEDLSTASGVPATILRNNWYTENYRGTFDQARATGRIKTSAGTGRVASATREDYADAAAVVLTTEGHDGAVYELSGDTAWDHEEFAATAAHVLGTEVDLVQLAAEQQLQSLIAHGLDEATAGFVVALEQNTRDGALGQVSGDLARLLGRPTTPLATTMRSWV